MAKPLKSVFTALLLLAWCILMNSRLNVAGTQIPPLGKFLSPSEGFWQNADTSPFPFNETFEIDGLQAPVSITFDDQGVPHIFAENRHDLYAAQGYVVAQLRLWQMEFQVMAASGRISEIIGEGALNFDRLQRRKGMNLGATKSLDELAKDPMVLSYVESYANGVNAYINSLSYADLPIEYKLLDYRPEEWQPYGTALILQYMIDNLTGYDEDLLNSNTLAALGEDRFNFLFPERPAGVDPVVPTGSDNGWKFEPLIPDSAQKANAVASVNNILPMPDPDNGSNNWAVSGTKTASGVPILANDTHLGLNLPSLWIMMHLNAPDYNVYGFQFTGAPGVTIGFNDHNAWGFTNGPRDHKDWYKIQFKDETQDEYLYDGMWRPTIVENSTYKIRGAEDFSEPIYYTHHGPVVYDKNFGDEDPRRNFALKWIGHNPSRVQEALFLLNTSTSYEDYTDAIKSWDAPPQNIVFASKSGDIALWNQGQFPLKWAGQGKFIMDGSEPANDYNTLVPQSHNPFQHNPERGYVSSANQHSVDSLYPYWVWNASYEFQRNRLINRYLDTTSNITVEDMMALQNNNKGLLPEETLPTLMASLDMGKLSPEQLKLLEPLKQWNYYYEVDQEAPVIFHMWWDHFYRLLWDEFYDTDVPLLRPKAYYTSQFIKNTPDDPFVDNQGTEAVETLSDLVAMSLDSASREYSEWVATDRELPWGEYKDTMVKHLADQGGSLAPFSRRHIMVGGQSKAINSTKGQHGPSQRIVIKLTDPPQAWWIYPGGQNGNPGSPMYDNMIDMWRDGQYLQLNLMNSADDDRGQVAFKQTLNPKK